MTRRPAFSLIELLVALSILAVVAAIVVPKFIASRKNAGIAVAYENLREFQNACRQFISLGGTIDTTSGSVMLFLYNNGTNATGPRTPADGNSDSSGALSSYTIAFNPRVLGTTVPTADSPAGFSYVAAAVGPVPAKTAFYCDGNANAWSMKPNASATGDLTVTTYMSDGSTTNLTGTAASLYGTGSTATSGQLP